MTKPLTEVIVWTVNIPGISAPKVHIGEQAIETCAQSLALMPLRAAHPGENRSISIGKFLEIHPIGQRHLVALGDP